MPKGCNRNFKNGVGKELGKLGKVCRIFRCNCIKEGRKRKFYMCVYFKLHNVYMGKELDFGSG